MATKDDKKARLAEALRHNLRRRKAQARGQGDNGSPQPSPASDGDGTAADDQGRDG
jgi:hypothetical protein